MKIATLLFLLIYSLPFARAPFSWAARHTTVCLDIAIKLPMYLQHQSQFINYTHFIYHIKKMLNKGEQCCTASWETPYIARSVFNILKLSVKSLSQSSLINNPVIRAHLLIEYGVILCFTIVYWFY